MFFLRNILKFTHINVMLCFLNFFVIPYFTSAFVTLREHFM